MAGGYSQFGEKKGNLEKGRVRTKTSVKGNNNCLTSWKTDLHVKKRNTSRASKENRGPEEGVRL